MAAMTSKTKIVNISHQCFECKKTYSTPPPQSLRQHKKKHNIQLPHRATGIRCYDTGEYIYFKATKSHDNTEKHFGCPVCIAHFMEIDELQTHYYASHLDTLPEHSQTTSKEEPTAEQQPSYNNEGQPKSVG